jgi:pyridoxine 5-phosphate synthase
VRDLAELLQAWPDREFNVEGNPFHNVLDCVCDLRNRQLPVHQVTFVPDSEGQFTSDHGWNFPSDADRLRPLVAQAQSLGLRVSLFMDADPQAMTAAKAVGADRIELYTEPYAASWGTPQQTVQLARFAAAAQAALDAGLGVNAGHDLNRENLTEFIKTVPAVAEVSIGHALIADALELGYSAAVQAYLRCIHEGL